MDEQRLPTAQNPLLRDMVKRNAFLELMKQQRSPRHICQILELDFDDFKSALIGDREFLEKYNKIKFDLNQSTPPVMKLRSQVMAAMEESDAIGLFQQWMESTDPGNVEHDKRMQTIVQLLGSSFRYAEDARGPIPKDDLDDQSLEELEERLKASRKELSRTQEQHDHNQKRIALQGDGKVIEGIFEKVKPESETA